MLNQARNLHQGDVEFVIGEVMTLSRQARIGPLSPWLQAQLEKQVRTGVIAHPHDVVRAGHALIARATRYKDQTKAKCAVLGMSGGLDSAVTAAKLKEAGWKVIGVTMPIAQDPVETERGIAACQAIGVDEHIHVDLTDIYQHKLNAYAVFDPALLAENADKAVRIRRGNLRARTRMEVAFGIASQNGGCVASTDNVSEYYLGFWTKHGDVGDFSIIQSLTKSWEIPLLARHLNVPQSIVEATPTDGLGIDAGDEAQIGCSYLEGDLMFFAILAAAQANDDVSDIEDVRHLLGLTEDRANHVFDCVTGRQRGSWFKRTDPVKFEHPHARRLQGVDLLDRLFYQPPVVKE